VAAATLPAVTWKLALLCPACIEKDAGAGTALVSWLVTATEMPPPGAGALSVRVTVTAPPEVTVAGLMAREASVTEGVEDGVTRTVAVWVAWP
jgi:hypothetical protein